MKKKVLLLTLLLSQSALAGVFWLHWTWTGDDGYAGTADHMVLKYNRTNAITTEQEWQNAIIYNPSPIPKLGGTPDSIFINTLSGDTWWVCKVYDDAGNVSGLSNSPHIVPKEINSPNSVNFKVR